MPSLNHSCVEKGGMDAERKGGRERERGREREKESEREGGREGGNFEGGRVGEGDLNAMYTMTCVHVV